MELKEKLRVKNFIVLKDVEIDIGRFNIVVGPQSSGKSLLAKLVHFFKGAGRDMSNGIVSEIDFDRIRVALRGKFIDRFGFGSKSTEEYLIRYEFLGEYIEIRGRGSFVKFEFSQGFTGKYKEVIREYNEGIEAHRLSFPEDFLSFADKREMLQRGRVKLREGARAPFFSDVLFIPASRAFFSIIQNFTFSLLENGSGLDAYIVDYGSACELSRYIGREDSRNKIEAAKYLTGAFKSLIQGEYSFEDGQHFIVKDGVQTSLTKASSAQQELVPMLWGLSVFALPTGESGVPRVCFIEEPEAHLFPDAQAKVMGVLSEMFNQHPLGCFITTHSPYCISTMNNFILAADLVESGKLSEEGAMKILGYGRPIKFEDVEAYYVNEGTVRSIKDAEYRLIVADELDAVSNHVDDVMTSLLEAGRD